MVAQMGKSLPEMQETWVQSLVGKIPWRKEWLPAPVFLPGKSHGQRSLAGYSLWGCKESNVTEQLTLDFGYIPRSGIAGSCGSSIFNFLRNLSTVLYSGCIKLHSYQQCTGVPFSLCPHQHLLVLVFLLMAVLTVTLWYFIVLLCVSLMISDTEHLFVYLLAIIYPFWQNVYSAPLGIFNCLF